jgi:hypothetical protein
MFGWSFSIESKVDDIETPSYNYNLNSAAKNIPF